MYDDRLYVANIGSLPENWTLDNLLGKHASKPYNPDVASVFYLAGFIESWGRGVEKICEALEKDGLPMPEYTVHPGDIMIKFTGPEDRIIRFTVKVTDNLTEKVTDNVTDRERQIIELIFEDPGYTTSQIAEKLSITRKTVSLRIRALKEKGIIERIGTDRKDYWKINL